MNGNNYRVCRIKNRKNFNGYGFNLETKQENRCRFIGIVDAGSPANVAGLQGGDKIIEINNVNIEFYNHEQIVKIIKDGLKINDQVYKDEVLLTVKTLGSKIDNKISERNFREPKFLKNLNFDAASQRQERGHKSSKSLDLLSSKSKLAYPLLPSPTNEPEIIIFI